MNDWLSDLYTIFDRIGDFFNYLYEAISSGIGYISGALGAVSSISFPWEIGGVIVLAIAVCVILLILGR